MRMRNRRTAAKSPFGFGRKSDGEAFQRTVFGTAHRVGGAACFFFQIGKDSIALADHIAVAGVKTAGVVGFRQISQAVCLCRYFFPHGRQVVIGENKFQLDFRTGILMWQEGFCCQKVKSFRASAEKTSISFQPVMILCSSFSRRGIFSGYSSLCLEKQHVFVFNDITSFSIIAIDMGIVNRYNDI